MKNTKQLSFRQLLDSRYGDKFIDNIFKPFDKERMNVFRPWYQETGESGEIYPSQGLLITPFDYLPFLGKTLMPEEEMWQTLKVRRYVLEIFNHPERLVNLEKIDNSQFIKLPKVKSLTMDYCLENGISLSIRDLGLQITGTQAKRLSRRHLLSIGPFIKLGKYARLPFSGGAMPDVFGSSCSLATMAACHCLACIPRNGMFNNIIRQVDLAETAIEWLRNEAMLANRDDDEKLFQRWQRNLVGVIEPSLNEGIKRAKALYKVGIRNFRVYSPEPGKDAVEVVQQLRLLYKDKIEIFAGQVAGVEQAQILEKAGADGLFIGIGGGGRCTTAVRSSSVVDWPELLWKLRGEISVPVIVEGGASDHIGTTLTLGASGIGVTRSAAGGTIESPGGLLYLVNQKNQWFKPYGGEASARTKYQDGKMMACNLPAFVEGETTMALKSYIPHIMPTLAQNMLFLVEDLILSLVFRGVDSIEKLQALNPSPLRRITPGGEKQQNTH